MPADPANVEEPIITTICVVETIMHEEAVAPAEGELPIFAVQEPVMKSDPVRVMVLARYAAAGLTLGAPNAGFTVYVAPALELSWAESPSVVAKFTSDLVPDEPYVNEEIKQPTLAADGTALVTVTVRVPALIAAVPPLTPMQLAA